VRAITGGLLHPDGHRNEEAILSSILHAPARKTVCFIVVVAVHLCVVIIQVPVPCVSRGTLGSRPEVRVVGQIVETTPAVSVAAGKSLKLK
jgi:hypothetical protein